MLCIYGLTLHGDDDPELNMLIGVFLGDAHRAAYRQQEKEASSVLAFPILGFARSRGLKSSWGVIHSRNENECTGRPDKLLIHHSYKPTRIGMPRFGTRLDLDKVNKWPGEMQENLILLKVPEPLSLRFPVSSRRGLSLVEERVSSIDHDWPSLLGQVPLGQSWKLIPTYSVSSKDEGVHFA
ncbi:hypothetical protein ACH5RR_029455 [Cinchona calisaya]|uniref:Uncharacterized protein n=1 Tax=Cinchona calisaya TaxID=153742 RepID=A0ABD2YV24_9GENT